MKKVWKFFQPEKSLRGDEKYDLFSPQIYFGSHRESASNFKNVYTVSFESVQDPRGISMRGFPRQCDPIEFT